MTAPPDDAPVDVHWSTQPDFIPIIALIFAMTNEI